CVRPPEHSFFAPGRPSPRPAASIFSRVVTVRGHISRPHSPRIHAGGGWRGAPLPSRGGVAFRAWLERAGPVRPGDVFGPFRGGGESLEESARASGSGADLRGSRAHRRRAWPRLARPRPRPPSRPRTA